MALQFYKEGLFWRVEVDDRLVSKKKFLRLKSVKRYYDDTQYRLGMPVIVKEKDDKHYRRYAK